MKKYLSIVLGLIVLAIIPCLVYVLVSDHLEIQYYASQRAVDQFGCAREIRETPQDPNKLNVALIGTTQTQFAFIKKKIELEFNKATKKQLNLVAMTIPNGSLSHMYHFANSLQMEKWDLVFFELSPHLINDNNPELSRGNYMAIPMLDAIKTYLFGAGNMDNPSPIVKNSPFKSGLLSFTSGANPTVSFSFVEQDLEPIYLVRSLPFHMEYQRSGFYRAEIKRKKHAILLELDMENKEVVDLNHLVVKVKVNSESSPIRVRRVRK